MKKNLHYLSLLGACMALFLPAHAQVALPDKPQRTDLPTLYIETEGKVPITSKEDYVTSTLTYVDGDSVACYEEVGIRGRGNSTWGLAKKPYRIKFDSKERFLGDDYANAKSWTLLANHADKTLMRNAVASEMGRFMGMAFNPAARFVDLYLNGTYLGNYQISDQVEVRKKRVDVEEQDYPLPEGADISGGYLLEVDGFATSEPVYFRTSRNLLITVKYPDEDEIVNAQKIYISAHVQKFENALFSENFTDLSTGYRAFVDTASLVDWYIATEYTGNVDGFWSTYISKDRGDDRLFFGPMWDHDIAFNNCNRVGDVSRALMLDVGFGSDLTKVWVKRMWEDPWFADAVNRRWQELVAAGIEEHLCHYIDSLAAALDRSQAENFSIWPINQRVYNEIRLFSTYQEGVDYLKQFIHDHTAFLTETFASMASSNQPPVETPSEPFVVDESFYYRISNKGSAMLLAVDGESTEAGAGLIMESAISGKESQQWEIEDAGGTGGYVRIVNSASGMAMTDMAVQSGGQYVIGSQLQQQPLDAQNDRQLWQITPVSTGNLYALINKATNLAINNSGGSSTEGNPVISYTNDARNEESLNRQWYVEKTEPRPVDTGIERLPESAQYAVYYDPALQQIRFAPEQIGGGVPAVPDVEVRLYSADGQLCAAFRSVDTYSMSHLPEGVYILSWDDGSGMRSLKFAK
ncbi:MAG: CotH kinase family protein [Bacteroidaceae bacterium]